MHAETISNKNNLAPNPAIQVSATESTHKLR
jgi:hypothetical protein